MKQVKTTRQYGIFINFRKIYANLLPLDTSLLFQKILKIQYSQTCVMFSLALILLSTSATDVMAGEGFQQVAPGLYFSSGVHQDFSKSNKGQIAN
ncbi:MAG: hypothetical protein N0E55_03840, partial [Candidatus Thiodiazotropha taylori]|nr:hypothetical protein [Candidatus Thiodiazotropha taylori]MCW4251821.1 hypothetical protein [Candidatus Thiodiazotropha taylori]